MTKASSGRNLDANLEIMPIWESCPLIYSFKLYICQDPGIARACTAQHTKKKTHFSLVSFSVYPGSRRGTEQIRQGEGRWSLPPKTALERSDLTKKFQPENPILLRPRRKKLLTESKRNNDHIYIYKPAPMLRVGQGSTSTKF